MWVSKNDEALGKHVHGGKMAHGMILVRGEGDPQKGGQVKKNLSLWDLR